MVKTNQVYKATDFQGQEHSVMLKHAPCGFVVQFNGEGEWKPGNVKKIEQEDIDNTREDYKDRMILGKHMLKISNSIVGYVDEIFGFPYDGYQFIVGGNEIETDGVKITTKTVVRPEPKGWSLNGINSGVRADGSVIGDADLREMGFEPLKDLGLV